MSINADKNRLVARNTLFLYLRMGVVLILSLCTTRVLLQVLGVEDYGIYNVVAGFVSLFGFLNASLASSIQRFYNYEGGLKGDIGWKNVYVTSIYIEILYALLILVLLETVGSWYISNKLVIPVNRLDTAKYLFHCSCIQMCLLMLQAPFSAMIMAKEHMSYYAIVGVVEVALKFILILVLPYIQFDRLIIFGVITTLLSICVFLMYYIYTRTKFHQYKFTFIWDGKLFKHMLSFSGWNIFGSVAMIARTQGVNILLNVFFSPLVNAARGVAFQIQSAVMGFTQNLTTAVRPQLTESYAIGDEGRTKTLMFAISKICFVLLYLLALPIIFQVNTILSLWLGDSVPEYTGQFTQLILIAALVDVLNSPITILMMASGKVKVYSVVTSLVGLLILPLSYVFLKIYDTPNIVFVIGIIVSIAVQIVSLIILQKQTYISLRVYIYKILSPIFKLVLLTFWIPILVDYIAIGEYWKLLITFILTTVSILVVTYWVVFNDAERKSIIKFIKG